MRSKIYTKTGDSGTTSLLEGRRVKKSERRLEAYGTLDELNSYIGLCVQKSQSPSGLFENLASQLVDIQNGLFCIGSLLAAEKPETQGQLPPVETQHISDMEAQIDSWQEELTPLKNFILPGGCEIACYLHIARCVCRRAERLAVEILRDESSAESIVYLNRLSDFLFVAARWTNFKMKSPDILWRPQTK